MTVRPKFARAVLASLPAKATLLRLGRSWAVIWPEPTAEEVSERWHGKLIYEVDTRGAVWWCAEVSGRKRRDVVDLLRAESQPGTF